MDKNAIKKYAVWARNELIARVTQKAEQYEITEKKTTPAEADSIAGRLLSEAEKKQRAALIEKIKTDGFEQVMEEVAYTWFNRFTALRFMEVNNYLPSHTRVFTNEAGEFKPQILTDAIQLDIEGLNMDKVFELKDANKTEELYKYLLITQCNALSSVLPRMFQKISHYTELLLPDYLLREGSVIEQMIVIIPEEDWTDQVQIIGWLYQYYNSEPKDAVFAALKKNVKISKENIPAATQLFTPEWIVRYMVENSLGRLWLEGHPNNPLKSEWKYYLDEAKQETDVQKQLDIIHKEYAELKPEDIRCIDPCMGSGHILCYMFDVLVKIYEDYGYTAREAVGSIVDNNLWGLDIDERAAQLSYFAVMMKARQYDRRFLTRGLQPHVLAIHETNSIIDTYKQAREDIDISQKDKGVLDYIVETFVDAKEYGSILQLEKYDYVGLKESWEKYLSSARGNMTLWSMIIIPEMSYLIDQAIAFSQSYDSVVTNPPYMGSKGMSAQLAKYVQKHYSDSKSDLFSVFIESCGWMTKKNGFQAMITQHAWMFLSSFEKLRSKIMLMDTVNMAHLGARAFEEIGGEVVQTTSFVFRHNRVHNYKGMYCRLVSPTTQLGKEEMFLSGENRFVSKQDNFEKVPGKTIAYWASDRILDSFDQEIAASKFADFRHGMSTSDNNKYLRLWFEPDVNNIGFTCESKEQTKERKWYIYLKGGTFRRWYGNFDYVVNWKDDGREIKEISNIKYPYLKGNLDFVLGGQMYFFKPGYTWSSLTTGKLGIRKFGIGCLFDAKGQCFFPYKEEDGDLLIAFYNSVVFDKYGEILSPTLDYNSGVISKAPIQMMPQVADKIREIVRENVELSKSDWDSFETSWDYKEHPFISASNTIRRDKGAITIKSAYEEWEKLADERFCKLKSNEEELNKIFIDIYGLEDELTPEVNDKDVSVRKADLEREVRSFISYAVGCMFGRYTLGSNGLVYAGGQWDTSLYSDYKPDEDGIIPICDDEYFNDDIVGRFVNFVEVSFGKETLEENLRFIADSLGGKGSSRDIIRNYFLNDFYTDHCSTYSITGSGKRPIYWLFDSGKKNGFKCLVYMHRYQSDTIARIRTDYVHEQQSRYRTAISDLEQRINSAATSERVKLNKQLATLQAQATEIREYEEKIHHLADQMISIDLDDGVKHNYEIFKDVLAKIK